MAEIKTKGEDFNISIQEMTGAGLYWGHKSSRTHPKMKPYITGLRNDIHIIDLEKTAEKLTETLLFIQKIIRENKNLLIVGTKIQSKNIVKEIAKECGLPYISERWLGGTFTNFETLKKRIAHFKGLEEKKEKGELEKYTKKERAKMDKELKGLEIKFGGIKNMEKLPDAVFVLDMRKDSLAIKESLSKRIPVIAIADTNVDPTTIDYMIPANDDAIPSIRYILGKVKEVVIGAKAQIPKSNTEKIPKS